PLTGLSILYSLEVWRSGRGSGGLDSVPGLADGPEFVCGRPRGYLAGPDTRPTALVTPDLDLSVDYRFVSDRR
uniref:CUB domain-containing protein n=1 Tax=Macrostomum lignano TaxID=282301 RepID=A0A1I8GHY5_9PLAT